MNHVLSFRASIPGTRDSRRGICFFFLASLLLCLPASVSATTVTGRFNRPDGAPIHGTVEFVLSQQAKTTTPPVTYAPVRTTCPVTNGEISPGCTVQGNDTLDPAGTFCRVRVLDLNNIVVVPEVNYTLTGAAVDLGELPVTADATLVPPTGSVTGNLNVTGNLTVGGSATFGADPQTFANLDVTGNLRLPGPSTGTFKRLNQIRLVDPDLWTETGVSAKIDAAFFDCIGVPCAVVLPTNLGSGEPAAIPHDAVVLDLRQNVVTPNAAGSIPGVLLRRRATTDPGANFRSFATAYLDFDAQDGGSFNATSKNTYSPLRMHLAGRTQGQHIGIAADVFGYGIGDALLLGGTVVGYGGKQVNGTSQPNAEFAEVRVEQGALVFTAQISGDPPPSAQVLSYVNDTNESVLGERALLNLSRTTTAGSVTGISGDIVTFSGAPDWTALSPSVVGQYFKMNASDVSLGGVSTGHWYRVIAAPSATALQLEAGYDTTDLPTSGAYTVAQGAEIIMFTPAANTLTIEANGYDWGANDNLISPPMPLMSLRGLNLFLTKQFKTGTSRALNITNSGPVHWDAAIHIEGAPSGDNAWRDGIAFLGKYEDILDLSGAASDNVALRFKNNQLVRWGTGATGADFTFDAQRFNFNRGGILVSSAAGTQPLLLRHAASPTVDHLLVQSSASATIFNVDANGVVNLKPAFGTGLKLDPNTGPTVGAQGNNSNVNLDFVTKGTGAVRVNAQASTGAGGLAVFDGAATPNRIFSVSSTGIGADDRGFKHRRVSTGSIAAGSHGSVTVNWTTAFADANYTATCSIVEATAGTNSLRIHHLESVTAGSLVVRVVNDDGSAAKTGTLHCTAIHD